MKPIVFFSVLAILSTARLRADERVPVQLDNSDLVPLAGHRPPAATASADRGSVDPRQIIHHVSVVFRRTQAQQNDFDNLRAAQHNPASPLYQRWLTPAEFAARFGLDTASLGRVRTWLENNRFTIDAEASSRNWIAFSGPAALFDNTFHTALHHYEFAGKMHFAPSSDPVVPRALEPVILGMSGLDDFNGEHVRVKTAQAAPSNSEGNARNGLSPADILTIYGIAPLRAAGLDGTGQTIAIVGLVSVQLADLAAYRTTFNLPARDPQIIALADPDISTNSADPNEPLLDLEISAAVAPQANQIYVYATQIEDAFQYVIDKAIAPVLSSSFHTCEIKVSQANLAILAGYGAEADVKGISWINSSGDSGPADCDPHGTSGALAQMGLSVNAYAAIPEVTGVGGTEFNDNGGTSYWNGVNGSDSSSASGYIPEMAWNDSTVAGELDASGGGVSTYFPKPSWQSGPGVPSGEKRDVPDIAFTASGIHDAYLICNSSQCINDGGTSASTPLFAGIATLLNQFVHKPTSSPGRDGHRAGMGSLNSMLYQISNACPARMAACPFHDITIGNNQVPCLANSPDCVAGSFGYSAAAGYDLVTGLGSIDANLLLNQWLQQTLPNLIPTTTTIPAPPTAVQLASSAITITVSVSTNAGSIPPGNITLTVGASSLGSMPLSSGSATFNLFTSQLPPGTTTITARYPGGSGFGPSSASIQVTSDITSAKKPSLQIFVNPNPANQSPAAYGNAWNFTLTLREVNGVPFNFSSLTHLKFYPWSSSPSAVYLADCLNNTYGYCSSSTPSDYFGASTVPAYGSVSIPFQYAAPAPSDPNQVWKLISSANTANPAFVRLPISYFPGALVIEFDTPGATTTSPDVVTSVTVPLLGRPAGASIHLIGAPSAVLRNPGAPPSCQWSHQLMLTESAGTAVTLKHFVAGGTDMSSQIAALWGSTRLGSNNALTASICWANLSAPVLINYEIDGVDDNGNSVTAAMTSGFLNQPSTPTTLTVASTNLSVNSGTLSLNSAGGSLMLAVMTQLPTQVWSVSIFATGNSPNWVTAGPASGMGPGAVLVKPVSGLSAGTYSATILFESADSTPQIVSFPVTYTVR